MYGSLFKSLEIEVNVSRGRPTTLIQHEKQCFEKMAGLPALLLDSPASGRMPDRYKMTVDEASFGWQWTVGTDADGKRTKRLEFIGVLKLSETLCSVMQREWFSLSMYFVAFLNLTAAVVTLYQAWFRRKP